MVQDQGGIQGGVAWHGDRLGLLYVWSSAIQGRQGPMTIPTMLKVLFSWLADRLEGGGCKDAEAEDGRAWVGGFLEIVPGCQGPWFSLEVDRSWPLDHSRSPAPIKLLLR